MKNRALYLTLIIAVLFASFLAWDAINRRPLRVEGKRQFTINKQDLPDDNSDTSLNA